MLLGVLLRKKTAQAVVELLLLIALLTPILIYVVNQLREQLSDNLGRFIKYDLQTQVRYGYSLEYMSEDPSGLNRDNLDNIEGAMPVTMRLGTQGVHPVQKVEEGWYP